MISSIVFANAKGEILIYRMYRNDVTRAETLNFCTRVIARKENKETPIINIDGTSFIHVTVKDVTLLATAKSNVNAIMTIQFLYAVINLYKAYFGGELDESHVRKHFVLVYELLDEVMDYGVPQILEPDLLKKYIMEGGVKINSSLKQITGLVTGAVSWRDPTVFHEKNEVYLDIIESVNVILSNKGTVLRSDVKGQIVMKCKLSGKPECKLGMNDKLVMQREGGRKTDSSSRGITIDDVKFHQCVSLSEFDKARAITFIPPEGSFELMSYRITENVNLPFKVMPVVTEIGTNRIEVTIKLKALFEKTIYATNVVLKIPCPKNTALVNTSASVGRAKYEPENGGIMWRIKKFQGETETLLRCDVQLSETTNDKAWGKPPISMDFQVPMFTSSGLRVRFLKVHETSGYRPVKWIRYITKAGDYNHRI